MYISRTPANATINGGPSQSARSPSTVAFSFAPQINSSVGAPIASAQCLLQNATDQPQVMRPLCCSCAEMEQWSFQTLHLHGTERSCHLPNRLRCV